MESIDEIGKRSKYLQQSVHLRPVLLKSECIIRTGMCYPFISKLSVDTKLGSLSSR